LLLGAVDRSSPRHAQSGVTGSLSLEGEDADYSIAADPDCPWRTSCNDCDVAWSVITMNQSHGLPVAIQQVSCSHVD
jgi:hypothetical protein